MGVPGNRNWRMAKVFFFSYTCELLVKGHWGAIGNKLDLAFISYCLPWFLGTQKPFQ